MMENGVKKDIAQEQQQTWTRRRVATAGLMGVAAVFVSGCIGGGGGGDSSDDVNLRAVYDRIQKGMDINDVELLVGVPASAQSPVRRNWEIGGQGLYVGFADYDGRSLVSSAIWKGRTDSLTKTYNYNPSLVS